MIARVIENNTGKVAEGAMTCDGHTCEGGSWITAERVISVNEGELGYITAEVEHASGDLFTLKANYAQRLEFFH